MILLPIAVCAFYTWYLLDQFKTSSGESDSYTKWLNEPNDLEIV